MSATKEQWRYGSGERVWAGKYRNSQNTLHWHSDCELIYAERGTLDVVCDGASFSLGAGDAMFIDGQSLHRINATDSSALLITVIFDADIIADFAKTSMLSSPFLSRAYGIPDLYAVLLDELTEKRPLYIHETATRVKLLMLDIFRNEPTEQKKIKSSTDKIFKSLFAEIQKHFDTYTLDDASRFMGVNASYLSRFFAAKTGMHFMRYVNCVRVEKAVQMLKRGDDNVTEVASKCGFGTIRNFNRIFKLLTGYSPSRMPRDFSFTAAAAELDGPDENPTLSGCELVERSSCL